MSRKRLKSAGYYFPGAFNMRVSRVICTACNSNAVIKKTVRKHRELSDLYCSCTNIECGHTFKMHLSFASTISPSAISQEEMVKGVANALTADGRQMMLSLLQQTL